MRVNIPLWFKLLLFGLVFGFVFAILCHANPLNGATILRRAVAELGHGEQGGDNRGADIRKYLRGQEGLPWCAAFVSYVLKESRVQLPYTLRARDFLLLGERVPEPQVGDLIVFWRGNRNSGKGHVGIVARVTKFAVVTIEGNVGKYPAKVKYVIYERESIPRFIAFIRVAR